MSLARPPSHGPAARAAENWLKGRRKLPGGGRGLAMLSILSAAAGGILMILQCWLVARIISAAVLDHAPLGVLMHWLWPLLAVMVLRAALDLLRQGFSAEAAFAIKTRLRADLTERLTALGPGWMEGERPGAIAGTLSEGIEAVEAYFSSYLPQKIIAAFIPLAILIAVFPFDWVTGLILVITLPIVPLFMIIIGKGAEALSQKQWHRLSALGAHVFDAIAGLTTLRQFAAAAREAEAVGRTAEDYRRATMTVLRLAFLSSVVLEFFATISVAMVAVYVGFRLYYGHLAFLPGLFALLLAPEFYRPLRDMGAHYHARMDAIGAVEGFARILRGKLPAAGAAEAMDPAPVRRIAFENVDFRYGEGAGHKGGGLSDLSFTLEAGQVVALLGPSGAGKTTAAKLLLGLMQPQSGRITIDGQNLAGIDPAAWRARLGWMPQRATLFAGTIAENIRLARPGAGDDEMREAARLAQASDFIEARPEGYETLIGDGGRGLSGGQAQRVAIARMLLAGPEVMILDEPTAALDLETGHRMMRDLRAARPDAAILLITHDVDLARAADRVIVLEHGVLAEEGAPVDLAQGTGPFAELLALTGRNGAAAAGEMGHA